MKTILLYLFFLFLMTNNMVHPYISFVHYFDEALTIFAICMILFCKKCFWATKSEKKIIFCLSGIVLIGVVSTILFHIQKDFGGVWRDFVAIIKFPLCYYVFYLYTTNATKANALNSAAAFSRIFIILLFIFGIINLLFRIPLMTEGYRYGLPLFGFLYTHNTFLVTSVVAMIGVLCVDGIAKNRMFLLFGTFVLMFTLRSKAFPIVALVLVILFIKKRRAMWSVNKLLIFVILAIYIAIHISSERLDEYIEYADMTARGALYIKGISIANNFFPLGSGFCTFASALSGKYYSPLYYTEGISSVWGITEEDYSYAADTFWPNIYAQYGYIGFALYLMMLLYMFRSVNSRFQYFSDRWIGAVLIFVYTLSASTAEAIYTNDSSVIFAVILGLYMGENNKSMSIQKL